MKRYRINQKYRGIPRRVWLLVAILLVLALGGAVIVRHVYNQDLAAVSGNAQAQIFTVPQGATVKEIALSLEQAKLIRSAWAFQLYVHSRELSGNLQAGTYSIAPSQSTPNIVGVMTKGKVTTKLVTILPGRRIDQVRSDLINAGFTPAAVDAALDPAQYTDLPVLSYKPASINTLEGLLWPDSYQKQPNTDPAVIIRESLTAMGTHLTPDIQAAFASEGLNTYQGLTLTSMVDQEVNNPTDQAQAAQVFLSRLKLPMNLGSDVTAKYGDIAAGNSGSNLSFDSPYNTLIHPGLPPSPISSISQSSLSAATHPAATNWLYFVTGDNGTTYFSSTQADHEALTQKYCHKLCGN
jgi:UPF0755 protein